MVIRGKKDDTLNKDTRNVDGKQSMVLRVTEQTRQDLLSKRKLGDTGGGRFKRSEYNR